MKITFKWIGAGCFVLEIGDQLKIACDPCLCCAGSIFDFGFFKSERLIDPVYSKNDFENIDLWLITHKHKDHLDGEGLKVIGIKSQVLYPPSSLKFLKRQGINGLKSMSWFDQYSLSHHDLTISISAVPAIHGSNMISSYLAGEVNGYWLNVTSKTESAAIYITGDTIWNDRVSKLVGNKICDIMIANMGAVRQRQFGGPLTLNSQMLQKMIKTLEPLVVFPIHYACFSHYEKDFDAFHDVRIKKIERGKQIEVNV